MILHRGRVWGNWTLSRTRFARKLDARIVYWIVIHWWVSGCSMNKNLNIVMWIPDEDVIPSFGPPGPPLRHASLPDSSNKTLQRTGVRVRSLVAGRSRGGATVGLRSTGLNTPSIHRLLDPNPASIQRRERE